MLCVSVAVSCSRYSWCLVWMGGEPRVQCLPLTKLSRWITGQVYCSASVGCCVRSCYRLAPARLMMLGGGWVVSCGPGAHFSRWCQDRGAYIMWQDKVGGFWYCIHAWTLIQLGGSRCGVVTPLYRGGRLSTSKTVKCNLLLTNKLKLTGHGAWREIHSLAMAATYWACLDVA